MKGYKLIKLIQVLRPEELKEARAYLANDNKTIGELFRILCQFHPSLDCTKLTKDYLYEKLFPKQPYNDGKMRKLMTHLSQSLEDYLIIKEMKKSDEIRSKLLSRAFEARGSYELFLETIESRLMALDKSPKRGRNYFREYYELCDMVYFHPESDKADHSNEYFDKAIGNFENYFSLVTLQNAADSIVRNRLLSRPSVSKYKDAVCDIVEKTDLPAPNAIHFFHQLVMLLSGQREDDLTLLKENYLQTFDLLNRFEQDMAINFLRNYAIPFSNQGSVVHTRFAFELYKMELNRDVDMSVIDGPGFMNIVSMGLVADEFDWVERFMEQYSIFLPLEEKEMTLNYCEGLWKYKKGLKLNSVELLKEAIKSINLIPIRAGFNYELRVRPTLIRIHFELFERGSESFDGLMMQVRNFERHLQASETYAETTKVAFLNFLRFVKIISRVVNNLNLKPSFFNLYLAKLKSEEVIAQKGWLLEKVEGLASKMANP